MAFVTTFTPAALRSTFTSAETSTECRLGLGAPRRAQSASVSMAMSGVFRDFLKTSSRNFTSGSTSYSGSVQAPVPGISTGQVGAPLNVPSQARDAMKDVVTGKAVKADAYMAECVTSQYKAMANPTGVYSIACTEGAAKLQAEESRELANMNAFRQLQRPIGQKYADMYTTRLTGVRMAHGCSHEEKQLCDFPQVAKAMVRGYSEAKKICVRYNTSTAFVKECGSEEDIASAYMSERIDMQYKQMACPNGEYAATCAEGNTAGLADFKRVQAMSARFRANLMPEIVKAQSRYDAKLSARTLARCCDYEEAVFNKFPATAAAMRPLISRY